MASFSKSASNVYKNTRDKLKIRKEITRLCGQDDVVSQSLANTLKISMMDCGAGSPDANFTAREMYEGRVVTRNIGELCRVASQPYMWAFLLFKLIRELRPSVCLELGTAMGISAAYQAAALELNQHGKIVTLEGSEALALLAKENLKNLGLERVIIKLGRFQNTLGEVLSEHAPIDIAFVDGHHDRYATLFYCEQILPFLSQRGVLVLDDISWSTGMGEAWDTMTADDRTKICVDLGKFGICVAGNSAEVERKILDAEVQESRGLR